MGTSGEDNSGSSFDALTVSCVTNLGILVCQLFCYGVALSCNKIARLLIPRLDAGAGRCRPCCSIRDAWKRSDEIYETDLDGAVVLRFCVLGFKFSATSTLMAGVLLPLYATGCGHDVGVRMLSLSNICSSSEDRGRLWTAVAVCYMQVAVFLHFVSQEWRVFAALRARHYEKAAIGVARGGAGAAQAARSLLVEAVPPFARANGGSGVCKFFEDLLPGEGVHSCVLQANTRSFYLNPEKLFGPEGLGRLAVLRADSKKNTQAGDSLKFTGQTQVDDDYTPALFEASSATEVVPAVGGEGGRRGCCSTSDGAGFASRPCSRCFAKDDSCRSCLREAALAGPRPVVDAAPGHQDLVASPAHGATESCNSGNRPPVDEAPETLAAITAPGREAVSTVKCELEGLTNAGLQALTVVQSITVGDNLCSTAFVTFLTVTERVVAEQVVLSHSANWRVRAAPEATDILWANAGVTRKQLQARSLLVDLGLMVGLVFWSIPISAIQAWAGLDWVPDDWKEDSGAQSFFLPILKENLPALGLVGLQEIVPVAIGQIATRYERYKVKPDVECVTLKRNFRFQFATIWATVFIGQAALTIQKQLQEIVDRPAAVFEILQTAVPAVSIFFVNYLMAMVSVTIPLKLWAPLWSSPPKPQLPPMGSFSLFSKSEEPPDDVKEPPDDVKETPQVPQRPPVNPKLAHESTQLGIVLILALTYSIIAPALMPICMLFFALAFMVYGWLWISVYTPEMDCKGKCWFELFNTTMLGLLLGTLSFAALALTGKDGEFSALLVLCTIEMGAWLGFHKYFSIPSQYMSLEDASALDRKCIDVRSMLDKQYYLDPILKENSDEQAAGAQQHEEPQSDEKPEPSAGTPAAIIAPPPSQQPVGCADAECATGLLRSLAGGTWLKVKQSSHVID